MWCGAALVSVPSVDCCLIHSFLLWLVAPTHVFLFFFAMRKEKIWRCEHVGGVWVFLVAAGDYRAHRRGLDTKKVCLAASGFNTIFNLFLNVSFWRIASAFGALSSFNLFSTAEVSCSYIVRHTTGFHFHIIVSDNSPSPPLSQLCP